MASRQKTQPAPTPLPRIEPRNPKQKTYLHQLRTSPLIFGIGPAGTGKTFMAAAVAAQRLEQDSDYKLIIIRPTVTVEGEDLGALPGGLVNKMEPYMVPVIEELKNYAGSRRLQQWLAEKRIEFCPVAYVRGRTFKECFVHVSEAQNLTLKQCEAIVTRVGQGATLVIEGDPDQTDLKSQSGLKILIRIAEKACIECAMSQFDSHHVVRSELARQWVEAFQMEKEGRL